MPLISATSAYMSHLRCRLRPGQVTLAGRALGLRIPHRRNTAPHRSIPCNPTGRPFCRPLAAPSPRVPSCSILNASTLKRPPKQVLTATTGNPQRHLQGSVPTATTQPNEKSRPFGAAPVQSSARDQCRPQGAVTSQRSPCADRLAQVLEAADFERPTNVASKPFEDSRI